MKTEKDFNKLNRELRTVNYGELRDRVNSIVTVREVLEKRGFSVNINGKILCPLPDHDESTPSFFISRDDKMFKCFGCHRGGSAVELVMHLDSITQRDAIDKLVKEYKVPVEYKDIKEERSKPVYDKNFFNKIKKGIKNYSNENEVLRRVELHGNKLNEEDRVKVYQLSDILYLSIELSEEEKQRVIKEIEGIFRRS